MQKNVTLVLIMMDKLLMNIYDRFGAIMKPGLYYYEPKDLLFEFRYYNYDKKYHEIVYIDFFVEHEISFPDVELSGEFIENTVYIGEV